MDAPRTLAELHRWAVEQGLSRMLGRPYRRVVDDLTLPDADEKLLDKLATTLAARTMLAVLGDRNADRTLAALTQPHRVAELLGNLGEELQLQAYADLEDDDLDELDPALDAAAVLPARAAAPPIDPGAPRLDPVPSDPAEMARWAERHGVAERLGDPVTAIAPLVYTGDPFVMGLLMDPSRTIGEALTAKPPAPGRREVRWMVEARNRSVIALRDAAGRYLFEVARVRLAVIAYRERLAYRSRPPAEPALVALLGRLEALRRRLAGQVRERPLGTYLPSVAGVEEAPLRITYMEGANLGLGIHAVQASIAVEPDPPELACSCPVGRTGPCPHLLAAVDAARELLRDPTSEPRQKLALTLSIPPWERFLRAFGDELSRREAPAPPEDQRLAWRIVGEGAEVGVEPLIQKRLKGGGFSVGQRVHRHELELRRDLLADPHDARVWQVLNEGLEETAGALLGPTSRRRTARVIDALSGHPRVVLAGTSAPARITRERLQLSLDPDDEGVSVSFLLGGRRHTAAELRAWSGGGADLIVLDREAGTVIVCSLDERTQALLSAFERHPARFPPESHDQLLRGLGRLQESVDLAVPEALTGEPITADLRPVVRLSPSDAGDLDVELLVRPAPGGPTFHPGEGPETVLHAHEGRRVAARRDRPAEVSTATAVLERLAPTHGAAPTWAFHLEDEAALDLIAALRELGDAVVVEWPEQAKRLAVTGRALTKELRVRVTDRRDWFGVEGEVDVDGVAVPLAALLEAVRKGRRYLRIGPGRFAQIEEALRRRVAAADDVLHAGRHGLEVALAGVPTLADLVDDPRHLQAAARWRALMGRLDAARTLDPPLPEGLTATLRPYQLEGYKWMARLAAWGAGACLADDMGLGKTVQALALLLSRADAGPALVIAPTSVGPNWIREAERFAPTLRASLYRGPGRAALLEKAGPGHLLVTSYAVAVRDAEALGKRRFGSIVLDEAQAIKNALTRRARAVRGIDAGLRVALTGTPVENHLGELWSLMRVVAPGLLGSWDHFRDRFATPIERNHDAARGAALARLVRPFLLRRTKAEVAPELPPRTEIERFVDLSAAERWLYDEARREALEEIASGAGDARFAMLAALTRLRRLACHPRLLDDGSEIPSSKLRALLETVRELREEGHRALVFSQFTTHLALVREALDKEKITYEYLDGSTPSEERTRRIDAFQDGRSDLFLISLKAGGTGLNLTAADYVIHLDPWWNPAVEDQATDRAHRIGQTRAVTVIRLVTRGTIEEAVLALHGDKRALAASVFTESGGAARLSTEDLAALIRAGEGEVPADEGDAAGDEELAPGDDRGPPSRPPVSDEPPASQRPASQRPASQRPASQRPASQSSASQGPAPGPESVQAEVAAAPEAAGARPAAASPDLPAGEALVTGVIGYLAEQRGIKDPRYDATLRSYERSLRRFVEYLAGNAELRARPVEEVGETYLAALEDGRWAASPSQRGTARTVMKHLKAWLATRGGA
jgi:superfamily II DNA or RNA helicase